MYHFVQDLYHCTFMVLLISEVAKIGATKPIFLDSGSPRGGGDTQGSCMRGHGLLSLYSSIVQILNSSKKLYFFGL